MQVAKVYGLKQTLRRCNTHFDEAIRYFDFIKNKDKPYVYKMVYGSIMTFSVLYIDDILMQLSILEVLPFKEKC